MANNALRLLSDIFCSQRARTSQTIKKVLSRNITCNKESMAVMLKDFGDPRKVLTLEKIQIKPPSEKEVLVRMLMAPINPSDINMIEGTYHIRPKLPCIVGNEGVGEVLEVGKYVTSLKQGDWVLPAGAAWGTWRQIAVTNEHDLLRIDNDIPVLSAATIMVNPCTAYRMLKDYVKLKDGDLIIQNGANSAVGQCVIQLAKVWNIKTINIVRDRPDIDALKTHLIGLGATYVVTEEFAKSKEMKDFLNSFTNKPKLALNCVGGKSATELARSLQQKGIMVTYGGMSKQPVVIPTGALIFNEVRILGYWNTQWNLENANSSEKTEMYKELCNLIRNCKLVPPLCEMVPLNDFKEGIEKSLTGFQNRKKVLVMSLDTLLN